MEAAYPVQHLPRQYWTGSEEWSASAAAFRAGEKWAPGAYMGEASGCFSAIGGSRNYSRRICANKPSLGKISDFRSGQET